MSGWQRQDFSISGECASSSPHEKINSLGNLCAYPAQSVDFEPILDKWWKKDIIANYNGLRADDELNLSIDRSDRGDERRKQFFNYLLEIQC
ncbi:hypothetical protein PHMEG_00027359 [Phytophthora megakarya]|uniref:Uncharacterized protein n=1 Tax=Phytophthora megakarya TaxID=4795 RepID=A0A225V7D4_9STRA|nr:hypothetical protein PHMEG_00027359 [Phytophthora megakarya]